jgi:hypothetical protein
MNLTAATIRILLVPLMTLGMLAGSVAGQGARPTQSGKGCCQAMDVNSACCGLSCCQSPAPQPERSSTDLWSRLFDRSSDGKISWAGAYSLDRAHSHAAQDACDIVAPASAVPSLIVQHVRLQI